MTKDQFNIEMEDISIYLLERSADCCLWEEVSFAELNEDTLSKLCDEKLKLFFSVIRNGSAFKLNNYFYRINTD